MSQVWTDIIITTKDRPDLLAKSLSSLEKTTDRDLFRLTVAVDGTDERTVEVVRDFRSLIDFVLLNERNEGLAPTLNRALAHVDSTNRYYDDPNARDASKLSEFICYCQDDLLYPNEKWLERLIKSFSLCEKQYNIGFASGVECVEHETKKKLAGGMVLKDWIRAAQMFGRRSYWMSMWPIPRFDPETRHVRAKPNDGIGSGTDWHFIRNHQNSICKTGKTCLVIPGLVVHAGYKHSTWLKRELPESDSDKAVVG